MFNRQQTLLLQSSLVSNYRAKAISSIQQIYLRVISNLCVQGTFLSTSVKILEAKG